MPKRYPASATFLLAMMAGALPSANSAAAPPDVAAPASRPAPASSPTAADKSPSAILAAAPASAWRALAPEDLLVMELAGGGRVVIALAPAFAPVHVANIRRLARTGWFDETSINRVQDDYVVQWGDGEGSKPLPASITAQPPAEYERARTGLAWRPLGFSDAYAREVGFVEGWPAASDGRAAWLVHCYGMVGVGRGLAPDTGTGAELYSVIGHAPRHLDRNIAMVGRVVEGQDLLAARPRGTLELGFYATAAERAPIARVRLASDMPPAERPAYAVMRTESASFAAWVHARANRKDAFFVRPAGAVDICNAMPPVRPVPR